MSDRSSNPSSTRKSALGSVNRTTLALPCELLEAADQMVRQGRARSRNELVANALRHELALLERVRIDAQFLEMARDQEYQREAQQILAEFAQADWEALHGEDRQASDTDEP